MDFRVIWDIQAEQQIELGLDPSGMDQIERVKAAEDLVLLLHEEATEIGRLSSAYKLHMLSRIEPNPSFVAEEVVDVLKTALALAHLYGLEPDELERTFIMKTQVISAKARAERIRLETQTKLVCLDLDDVLADLSEWRAQVAKTMAGMDAEALAFTELLKDEFYSNGEFRKLVPIPGAPEAVRQLKDAGWTVAIVTARPNWQYKRLYGDTLWWLNHHSIPYDLLLFNKDKVEAIHRHICPAWPAAFVEDHERNARSLAEIGVNVLLYDRPHNRSVPEGQYIRRVYNWKEVLACLIPG